MMKILITGFKHSGTTMMMNLLNAHPQVGYIENESGFIEYDEATRQWVLDMARAHVPDFKKQCWGEKLPWGTRENDLKAKRAIGFTKKWLSFFRKDGRVIHIIRHPVDVALSRFPLPMDTNVIGKEMFKYCTQSVPLYIDFINTNKRCATVVYEDVLTDPQRHLRNVFDFVKIESNSRVIHRVLRAITIKKDRAFAYRKKDVNLDFVYDKLLERIENRI